MRGLNDRAVPTAIATIVMTGFVVAAMDSRGLASHSRVDTIDTGFLGTIAAMTFGMLVGLPAAIVTYR